MWTEKLILILICHTEIQVIGYDKTSTCKVKTVIDFLPGTIVYA